MRAIAIAIAIFTLASATEANAQDVEGSYVVVDTTPSGSRVLIDAKSLRANGSKVTVWIKMDHSKDNTTTDRSSMTRFRFDCDERTVATLQEEAYGADGSLLREKIYKPYEVSEAAVVPGTGGEMILELACGAVKGKQD